MASINETQPLDHCPKCFSSHIVKNGTSWGRQKKKCVSCGKQFMANPLKPRITLEQWKLVDKLLLERLPIAGIARITGISQSTLQEYINRKYSDIEKKIVVTEKKRKTDHTM